MTEGMEVPERNESKEEDPHMEDCFCKTPFYHVRFPSLATQSTVLSAPATLIHDLTDQVYTKSNSTAFGITSDGKLYVKKPGTYLLYYDICLEGVDGDWHDSCIEAMVQVETPVGYSPYQGQLVRLIHSPVGEDVVVHRQARYHSTVMIHVGDVDYGVDSYGATLTFITGTSGGPFTYSSEIHATLTKL